MSEEFNPEVEMFLADAKEMGEANVRAVANRESIPDTIECLNCQAFLEGSQEWEYEATQAKKKVAELNEELDELVPERSGLIFANKGLEERNAELQKVAFQAQEMAKEMATQIKEYQSELDAAVVAEIASDQRANKAEERIAELEAELEKEKEKHSISIWGDKWDEAMDTLEAERKNIAALRAKLSLAIETLKRINNEGDDVWTPYLIKTTLEAIEGE